ncbi:MAG: class I SAM-dependent methyltransferase [Actinomycetota bacterium]|nr:class I SAM-dependent methyltransferase [Actinomycetota bacterium]MDQ2956986.1 class I SAM-dependent methyltransferase [Actinomycetota bacterium]
MTELTHLETTRRDYDSMAVRYAEFVGDPLNDEPFGLALIGVFADLVGARGANELILDAGCGPGHLTELLTRLGRSVRGVDLSPATIELARANRPDLSFEVGSILDLQLADGTFGGVLAHFSIIHTPPAQVPTAFAECARVLVPGGYLLLGFQSGNDVPQAWAAFDHKVSPAYRWSIEALAALLQTAGFLEVARLRTQPGPRNRFPAGYLLMQKADTG